MMSTSDFDKVRDYVLEMGYPISVDNREEGILVLHKPDDGVNNLILEMDAPLLILEQFLFDLDTNVTVDQLKDLLIWNAGIVHGALALVGNKLIFRDTLQLENLDLNEIEGSINSLKLFLAENLDKLLTYAHS